MYSIMSSAVSNLNVIEKWVLGKRTNKGERKEKKREVKPFVCDNIDTKIRVCFKKNILIVLNTADRSIMMGTENTLDFIMRQGVL